MDMIDNLRLIFRRKFQSITRPVLDNHHVVIALGNMLQGLLEIVFDGIMIVFVAFEQMFEILADFCPETSDIDERIVVDG